MNDEQMRDPAENGTAAPPRTELPADNASSGDANSTMGHLKQAPLASDEAERLGIGGNPNLGRETDRAGSAGERADEQISVDQATSLNAD